MVFSNFTKTPILLKCNLYKIYIFTKDRFFDFFWNAQNHYKTCLFQLLHFGVSPEMVVWHTLCLKTAANQLPFLARKNILGELNNHPLAMFSA